MDRQEFLQLQAAGAIPRAGLGMTRADQEAAVRKYFARNRGTSSPANTGSAASGGAGGAIGSGPDIDSRGGDSPGSAASGSSQGGGYNSTPGALVSPGGPTFGFDASKGAKGFGLAGVPGLLAGITMTQAAPAYNASPASIVGPNGFVDQYGLGAAAQSELDGILGPGFQSADPGASPTNADIDGMIGPGMDAVGPGDDSSTDASSAGAVNGLDAQSDAASAGGGYGYGADGLSLGHDGLGLGAGWAKGGRVTRDRLVGPDPDGEDEGYGALDHDEFVIKAATAKKLGFRKLEALNNGKAKIVMIGAKK